VIRASFGKNTAGRLLIGAGALALLIPAIAGCEAGSDSPTLEFHDAAAGAYATANGIRITDAFVLGAPAGLTTASGSSAGLFLSLYNGSASADKLLSATAAGYAASVAVSGTSVALPVDSAVDLMGPSPQVVLSGLTKPLTSGSYVPVTLEFEHAGTVQLQVPVESQSNDFATYSAPASTAPGAGGAASTATPAA
jgi:copper(I)-binding protein